MQNLQNQKITDCLCLKETVLSYVVTKDRNFFFLILGQTTVSPKLLLLLLIAVRECFLKSFTALLAVDFKVLLLLQIVSYSK